MDQTEILTRATIASALITSHAVEIPALPRSGPPDSGDEAAVRLRALTDYIYAAITRERG
jgi:hypothetical protein